MKRIQFLSTNEKSLVSTNAQTNRNHPRLGYQKKTHYQLQKTIQPKTFLYITQVYWNVSGAQAFFSTNN